MLSFLPDLFPLSEKREAGGMILSMSVPVVFNAPSRKELSMKRRVSFSLRCSLEIRADKYYKIESRISNPYTITDWQAVPKKRLTDMPVTFRSGEKILTEIPNPMVFKINYPAHQEPEPFLEATFPVVNDLFINTIKNIGIDNYQLFPAYLETEKTDKKWNGYYVFNVIGLYKSVQEIKDEQKMFRYLYLNRKELFITENVLIELEKIMSLDKWNITLTEKKLT
jgi:hypothetical protein